ncbi:MAG: hypothetical protein LBR71_05795, partial [Synergistaceae bacterium]|nr:hypothetical protein [Synergistaceae bacterium]
MTMLISFIVMGTMVMLLRYGVLLMAANLAYTAAVRGAMSSVEMLSDGLIIAEQVQIISDDNHIKTGLEAGLKDDWRYVVLKAGGKEVRH